MSILCGLFGHRVKIIEHTGRPVWQRDMLGNAVARDWHKAVYIQTICRRCGYMHGFSINADLYWPGIPS